MKEPTTVEALYEKALASLPKPPAAPPPPVGPQGLDCTLADPNSAYGKLFTFQNYSPNGADNGWRWQQCARWLRGQTGRSSFPIKYATGEIQMSVSDLPAGGYGLPWSHVRSYSNQLRDTDGNLTNYDFSNGYNWLLRQAAYIADVNFDQSKLVIVITPRNNFTFDLVSGSYVGAYGALQTLEHDATNHVYRFIQTNGQVWEFFDFVQTANPGGLLSRVLTQGTQALTLTYPDATSPVEEVQRSFTDPDGVTTVESFLYTYLEAPDENAGNIESVALRRQIDDSGWSQIRRANFTYYTSTSVSGAAGDLESAVHQVPVGAGDWATVDTYYYRYYRDTAGGIGFEHGLKFALEPAAFRRFTAAGFDPLLATDAEMAQYADFYFEYDDQQRVVLETVLAGTQTITYAYTTSANGDGYNSWKTKTVETRPDGSQVIVYTNFLSQVMLKELTTGIGGANWIAYMQYDDTLGSVILRAMPSAVQGYNDALADLGGSSTIVKASSGLVGLSEYYTTTTATPTTPGGVAGYLHYEKISEGLSGPPITLSELTYIERNSTDDDPGADPVTIYPVAASTLYQSDASGGSDPTTVSFEYEWFTGTVQMLQRTKTLPVIGTGQNGSGSANSQRIRLDELGYTTWEQGPKGYVDHLIYNVTTGTLTQRQEDVDPPSSFSWPAPPAGTRLNLITDYEYDDLGRNTQVLGHHHPVNGVEVRTASWTVYKDVEREVFSGGGYVAGTGEFLRATLVNPVSISRRGTCDCTAETIQAVRSSTDGRLSAADVFPQSSWVRWSSSRFNNAGQRIASRTYHTIPHCGVGASGANYDETTYGYDFLGRSNRIVTPGGTITRTTLDVRGLLTGTFVGTNDAGATDADPTGDGAAGNNMVPISALVYDGGTSGGDGLVTQLTQFVDANPANDRVVEYEYDFRNRLKVTDGEIDYYEERFYDNLDRLVKVERRNTSSGGNLIARSEAFFDPLSRVYQTKRWGVDPATGTVGNALQSDTWYDAAGKPVKQVEQGAKEGRAFTKRSFDSMGRNYATYVGYYTDTLPEPYADVGQITSDNKIFEQTLVTFDNAGNALQTATYQRFHDATGNGVLNLPTGSQPLARVSYQAAWYDGVGRTTSSANYGTNDDEPLDRPDVPPERSDTVLVTSFGYDDAGNQNRTTDSADRTTLQTFDAVGRTLATISNYVPSGNEVAGSSSPSSGCLCGGESYEVTCTPAPGNAENVTVRMTYNADGNLATLTACNPTTGDQVTHYEYGVTLAPTTPLGVVAAISSSLLLRSTVYPDAVDADDRVVFTYNRQSQVTTLTDQNGTLHMYEYDLLGRRHSDLVPVLGPGISNDVDNLQVLFDIRGLHYKASSTFGSTPTYVNQVQFAYNDFGQLATEYQEHSGAVNVSTTPKIEYACEDGSDNTIRPTSITYPDGRVLTYDYGTNGGDDDLLSRVVAIKESSTVRAEYTYYGLAQFCKTNYVEPGGALDLTYQGTSTDPYAACLDRLGRVIQSPWIQSGAPIAGATYAYDRASNRTQMQPLGYTATDDLERYSYDGANRLTRSIRGSATTFQSQESWNLDATGNWRGYDVLDVDDPTQNLAQTRGANRANEITGVSESYGGAWTTPVYDRLGNTTSFPSPLDPTTAVAGTYDAWNRLVASDGVTYVYDALNRRTTLTASGSTRRFYYSNQWQILEERVEAATIADRQFVWGLRYVDDQVFREESSTRLYGFQDANWNLVGIADASGTMQQRYRYLAYGQPIRLNDDGTVATGSDSVLWDFLYAGYKYDRLAGFYQARFRYLHPLLGRWILRDLLEYSVALNLYQYVQSNPLGSIDPLGLADVLIITNRTTSRDNIAWTCSVGYGTTFRDVGSNEQLISILENHVKSTGEKINTLSVSGHGFTGGVAYQAGGFAISGLTLDQIARLKPLFATDARIDLYACGTARGSNLDHLQSLSDYLGVAVCGSPYDVNAGPDTAGFAPLRALVYMAMDSPPPWITVTPKIPMPGPLPPGEAVKK